MKKMFVMMQMLLFIICPTSFAQNMELDFSGGINGVKITSYGNGYYVVELDGIGECIPLQIVKITPSWVKVICSDTAKKVTATAVGEGVKWVVEGHLAKYIKTLSSEAQATTKVKMLEKYGHGVAQAVATWATKLGHEKLCNYLAEKDFYEVVSQPYSW